MSKKIYNVIILDKSGSMSSIRRQAVDGVNETLGSIRSSKKSTPEVEQLVTIAVFCGCEYKLLCDKTPIDDVETIGYESYQPCCMTPLYDSIGKTLTSLIKHFDENKEELATASVTVITDGYENDSHEFNHEQIKALIDRCKNMGWLFAYIGAEHDVEAVAFSLNIDHHIRFDKSKAGTQHMFDVLACSRSAWSKDMQDMIMEEEDLPSPGARERLAEKMAQRNKRKFFKD